MRFSRPLATDDTPKTMYFARDRRNIDHRSRAPASSGLTPAASLLPTPSSSKNNLPEAFVSQTKQPVVAELCYTEA